MRGLKRLLPAGVASLIFVCSSLATGQTRFSVNSAGPTINGVPPSVTSFGFGGSPGFHGVPPSVTSLNFGRVSVMPGHGFRHRGQIGFGHHRRPRFANPFFGNVVAVPYLAPYDIAEPGIDDSMEQEQEDYRGGPTIFDRRGPGTEVYRKPEPRRETEREAEDDYRASEPQEQQPVAEQPETVLVFKDGHQMEVANYAIVGSTLYDLSEGRTRKVALAELDLQATVKQNDSRGVDFRLPATARAN
jgi:hypothetical protein